MSLGMKSINEFTQQKISISRCDVHTCEHAPKEPCAVRAQYAECIRHFQYTTHLYTSQSENKKLSRCV